MGSNYFKFLCCTETFFLRMSTILWLFKIRHPLQLLDLTARGQADMPSLTSTEGTWEQGGDSLIKESSLSSVSSWTGSVSPPSDGGELSLSDPDVDELPLTDNSALDNCKTEHSLSNLYWQKQSNIVFPSNFCNWHSFQSQNLNNDTEEEQRLEFPVAYLSWYAIIFITKV